MKKADLLKTEHQTQLNWITNQVAKIATTGSGSFLNIDASERAFKKLTESLVYDDEEIEHFVSVHLSKAGINKLVSALRVYENRNGSIRVQVELTSKNKFILDNIMKSTGRTQKDVINSIIANAKLDEFDLK